MPSNLNRADLITESGSLFPDNNSQLISPDDLRTWIADGTTSFVTQKDKSTLENVIYEAKASSIPAASTTDLSLATGNYVHITVSGSPTISSFGICPAGARFVLVFDGVCDITYNATSLIIPGTVNKTTAADDACMIVSEGSGNWRIVGYFSISGSGGGGGVTSVSGTAPISSSGGSTPAISISQANGSTDGFLDSADWTTFNNKQDTISAGTGISIASNIVTNTAPDQTVVLNAGTGIGVTGTYPSFTISASGTSSTSTVQHQVKLGENINKGQAVYVSSANGTNMIVSKASYSTEATSSKTMGLIDATGVTNDFVNVITEGLLAGLDTSAAGSAGDPVWLGSNGDLLYGLVNKPYAPLHLVSIGVVTRKNAVNGEIFVKVQNGFELKEIHDVQATSPSLNDTIYFDSADSQWKTAQVTAITPLASGSTTGLVSASAQTLGGIKTFTNGASAGEIRLLEPSGSGTNYVAIKSQAMSADYSLTLPSAAGTAGYYLQYGAGGNLSWANPIPYGFFKSIKYAGLGTGVNGITITLSNSIYIPAGTFVAGDMMTIYARFYKSNASITKNFTNYLYINTANSLSGSPVLLATALAGSAQVNGELIREISVLSSGGSGQSVIKNTTTPTTDWNNYLLSSSALALPVIDWSIDQYLIHAMAQNSPAASGELGYSYGLSITSR